MLDKKTRAILQRNVRESIIRPRSATEKEVQKRLKRAEKAVTPQERSRHFDSAIEAARRTERIIAEMETGMASILHPWHADTPRNRGNKRSRR